VADDDGMALPVDEAHDADSQVAAEGDADDEDNVDDVDVDAEEKS
jgi:hypothetical protein